MQYLLSGLLEFSIASPERLQNAATRLITTARQAYTREIQSFTTTLAPPLTLFACGLHSPLLSSIRSCIKLALQVDNCSYHSVDVNFGLPVRTAIDATQVKFGQHAFSFDAPAA